MLSAMLLALAACATAKVLYVPPPTDIGYIDPKELGGSMLTIVAETTPPGQREPLNLILSAKSDPEVLVDSLYNGGFQNYMLSVNLSDQCLGGGGPSIQGTQHGSEIDRDSYNVTQIGMLRWNFGDPWLGSCRQTFEGGLHFRYWRQAASGALFLEASEEMDLARNHDIVRNGYNLGRDHLVGNLTQTNIKPRSVTAQTVLNGTTSFRNYTYETRVHYVDGLQDVPDDKINHYLTVEEDGHPAVDGLVAVLTVKIIKRPVGSAAGLYGSLLYLLAASCAVWIAV